LPSKSIVGKVKRHSSTNEELVFTSNQHSPGNHFEEKGNSLRTRIWIGESKFQIHALYNYIDR